MDHKKNRLQIGLHNIILTLVKLAKSIPEKVGEFNLFAIYKYKYPT